MNEFCDWCCKEVKETIKLDMGDRLSFDICYECAENYIEGEFGIIKAKIEKVHKK